MDEGIRTVIGIVILVGVITFAATSGFWMFMTSNTGAYSDVMTRCAIESLDIANDFALKEEWITSAKFIDMATGFLWRASWERDIETKSAWNQHIIDLEIDMVQLMITMKNPYYTYFNGTENKTIMCTFEIHNNNTYYTISVENVTWAINKTIGELLPYSDIDPSYNEWGSSLPTIWEKYKAYYEKRPHSGGTFRVE